MAEYELIIRGGTVFDGTGGGAVVADVAVRDGRVVVVKANLEAGTAVREIDARHRWVLPGLIDVHTHYDAELLVSPGLRESVRHGVTSVLIGNCSLSTVYGNADDCADLFSRVEALPWDAVHEAVDARRDWTGPADYVRTLGSLPLGANVAALLGHSDMRVAAMGLARAVDRCVVPSRRELRRMEEMLEEALDAGFLGLSTIRSSFSKLEGLRYPARQLPSTYARWPELHKLHAILRRRSALLQCTPNLTRRSEVVRFLAGSASLGRRPPLKTTLLAAADLKADRTVIWGMLAAGRLTNTLAGGDFRWQHLPVPFEMYADGIDLVVFEEFGSGAAALNVRDELGRAALLSTDDYRLQFRKDCAKRFGARVWHRDLTDTEVTACPDRTVVGRSFGDVAEANGTNAADAFLDLVARHGSDLRWRTTIANHRPGVLDRVAKSPTIQIGFNDSGAHLRNMAFYNTGLRFLQRAHAAEQRGTPFLSLTRAVHRLTGELGEWYGIDAGHLRPGSRADIAILDPSGLADTQNSYAESPIPEFGGLSRMVNRNDRAVTATIVNGIIAYEGGIFAPDQGTTTAGRFLTGRFPQH